MMFGSIQKYIRKIKVRLRDLERREDVFVVLMIFLVGIGGFGLGRLSIIEKEKKPVRIVSNKEIEPSVTINTNKLPASPQVATQEYVTQTNGTYVASISGTKYHFPWCSGAQNIKEENKIWFNTKEEAEKAGYTPASNCKGL